MKSNAVKYGQYDLQSKVSLIFEKSIFQILRRITFSTNYYLPLKTSQLIFLMTFTQLISSIFISELKVHGEDLVKEQQSISSNANYQQWIISRKKTTQPARSFVFDIIDTEQKDFVLPTMYFCPDGKN